VKADYPLVHYAPRTLESSGEHWTRKSTGTVYRIVARDELSERFASAFAGMEMETKAGQMVLTGEVIDQPHLHGLFDRRGALGLKLVNVRSAAPVEHRAGGLHWKQSSAP
jgi:hypothetical protein